MIDYRAAMLYLYEQMRRWRTYAMELEKRLENK